MNRNLITLYVCCFWVVFVGCQSNENRESCDCPKSANKGLTYTVIDSFSIHLPDSFKENFFTVPLIQYRYDSLKSMEELFIVDIEKNILFQYDMQSKKVQQYLSLDSIKGVITDFQVMNDSVVYIVTSDKVRLWKVNHIKGKIQTVSIIFDELAQEHISTYPFIGDRLSVSTQNDQDYVNASVYSAQTGGYAAKKNIHTAWNLTIKKPQLEYVEYPEILNESAFGFAYLPAKVDVDSFTRIAWGFEHFVKSYNNTNGQVVSSHCVRSNFITEDRIEGIAHKVLEDDYQKMMDYLIEAPYYLSLLYDCYHHQYYRIAKHLQDLLTKTGRLNNRYQGTWSFIITDDALNVTGEVPVSGKEYFPYTLIPTRRGIVIEKVEKNKDLKNVLTFHIIKPNDEKESF